MSDKGVRVFSEESESFLETLSTKILQEYVQEYVSGDAAATAESSRLNSHRFSDVEPQPRKSQHFHTYPLDISSLKFQQATPQSSDDDLPLITVTDSTQSLVQEVVRELSRTLDCNTMDFRLMADSIIPGVPCRFSLRPVIFNINMKDIVNRITSSTDFSGVPEEILPGLVAQEVLEEVVSEMFNTIKSHLNIKTST